jgi:subtilisin family serine protease
MTPIASVCYSAEGDFRDSAAAFTGQAANYARTGGFLMGPLELVKLDRLMDRSSGRSEIVVGLIDGPVVIDHPGLAGSNVREIAGTRSPSCELSKSVACLHGTFVAGILSARRGSSAPAICPGCTLLVRPIFAESHASSKDMPSTTPEELAQAITDAAEAGAKVINLSAALARPSLRAERLVEQALDDAARRGVLVVAAAGNQGTVASSAITRHPWVIAVIGCDLDGRPTAESNLGKSIGSRGLAAPGHNITSLGTDGKPQTSGGTSAAAPFVTGAIALLWSEFPRASAAQLKLAVTQSGRQPRRTIAPPLLNAWASYEAMSMS